MALFFRDSGYDETRRQEGFNRYRQIMGLNGVNWIKVNMLTVLGGLPLSAAIIFSCLFSSVLVLLPASILGGMIFGPFLACQYDAIMRGLRDAPGNWWKNYKKSFAQNWRPSLLPGGLLGLIAGGYGFMIYILWITGQRPSAGTIALMLFGVLLLILINTLYWPQFVLFSQKNGIRLRNCILFTIKYFWKVLGASVLQLFYGLFYIFFFPLSLVFVPFVGFWFILFVAELMLYRQMDAEFKIEEQYFALEGNPWEEDNAEDEEEN